MERFHLDAAGVGFPQMAVRVFFIILGGISSKEKLGPNGHGSAALVRTAAGCHRKNFLVRNLTFAELWREGEEKFLPRKIFLLL